MIIGNGDIASVLPKRRDSLFFFSRAQIKKGQKLKIQDTYRYIIDEDEFLHWINLIPDWSCEMNVLGRRMKVSEIVDEYCYIGIKK